MADDGTRIVSPALASALDDFRQFVIADDEERSGVIEATDPKTLTALADAIAPLFGEINAVLDRLTEAPHPLPEDQELLEYDLNSLAQAAMEARQQLDS
jgi:hypothetical protein